MRYTKLPLHLRGGSFIGISADRARVEEVNCNECDEDARCCCEPLWALKEQCHETQADYVRNVSADRIDDVWLWVARLVRISLEFEYCVPPVIRACADHPMGNETEVAGPLNGHDIPYANLGRCHWLDQDNGAHRNLWLHRPGDHDDWTNTKHKSRGEDKNTERAKDRCQAQQA